MLTHCPNCGAIWGLEEIEFQECDCCGFPDIEDDENDFDFDNYDFDEDDEDNNLNDSRNL